MSTDDDWRLILIKQKSVVGSVLEDHQIYKVNKIIVVPLSDADPQELDLDVSVYFFLKYMIVQTCFYDQYSGAHYVNYFSLIYLTRLSTVQVLTLSCSVSSAL